MKKIVIEISDIQYEKFKYECIEKKKDMPTLIKERIFERPFSKEVIECYDDWLSLELQNILKEEKQNADKIWLQNIEFRKYFFHLRFFQ